MTARDEAYEADILNSKLPFLDCLLYFLVSGETATSPNNITGGASAETEIQNFASSVGILALLFPYTASRDTFHVYLNDELKS